MNTFELEIYNRQDALDVDQHLLRQTIEYVLDHFAVVSATLSLAIVDDQAIRQLKNRYFGQDVITDVISFNLQGTPVPEGQPLTLDCEVVVNAQRASLEAKEKKTNPQAELNLYVVHGLLHQLGYHDDTPEAAAVMHEKEDELLIALGLGQVYSGKG